MIVLGIDPGTAITGYGLVHEENDQGVALAYGAITTPSDLPLPDRLKLLQRELAAIVEQHHPDQAAVEQLFFNKNVRTALAVGHARGVVLLTLAQANVPIYEYTPLEVKQAVTGSGRADKRQVQQMVTLLLNLSKIPKPDDVADALAIALCHLHSAR
ncbi:MAG TPA: crossover junction endodeoxyribonuclease RuvC, partial [Anaerolineae bacterium]|nr:crossover junction endodeoxyribonuclease RuvC [Anaerolineae bacterium]